MTTESLQFRKIFVPRALAENFMHLFKLKSPNIWGNLPKTSYKICQRFFVRFSLNGLYFVFHRFSESFPRTFRNIPKIKQDFYGGFAIKLAVTIFFVSYGKYLDFVFFYSDLISFRQSFHPIRSTEGVLWDP